MAARILMLATSGMSGLGARRRRAVLESLGRVRGASTLVFLSDPRATSAGEPPPETRLLGSAGFTHLVCAATLRTADEVERAAVLVASAKLAGVPAAVWVRSARIAADSTSSALLVEIVGHADWLAAPDAGTVTGLHDIGGCRATVVPARNAAQYFAQLDTRPASPLDPLAWSAATRRVASQATATLVAPCLARGDGAAAQQLLMRWGSELTAEPLWAIAHAAAAALLGADREGIASLRVALRTHPDHPGCLAALAQALQRRGTFGEAATLWERLAAVDPGSTAPHTALATLALLRGDPVAACHAWAAAQLRQPGDSASRRALAGWFARDPAGEARFWSRLLACFPGAPAFKAASAAALARAATAAPVAGPTAPAV
jgi:hypothetical protein